MVTVCPPMMPGHTGKQDKGANSTANGGKVEPGAEEEEGQHYSTTFLPPLSLCALMKLVVKMLQASLFFFFFSTGAYDFHKPRL